MFEGLRLQHWRTQLRADGIVVLTLDRADQNVNALSRGVLDELGQLVERLAIEKPKGAVFVSAKKAGFIPGADIKGFEEIDAKGQIFDWIRSGQLLFDRIARLPFPTVAAIHGHCLGGGTELALACRYRVASNAENTRIGLPEVKLGIYPGWGGSVRAPRLLGAPAAMDLMLTGRALRAAQARAIGLVDKVVEGPLLEDAAIELAKKGTTRPLKQRLLAFASNLWPARQVLAHMMVKQVSRKARKEHYPAPYAMIEAWRRNGVGNVDKALLAEAKAVSKLAGGPTARNLVRVFLLMERLKGLGGKDAGGAPPPAIEHVHVVGAGVMGGDIAAWAAFRGLTVTLQDREMRFIEPALKRADEFYAKKIKDEAKRAETRARLQADVEGTGVARADLVIEAIFEDAEAKQALFQKAEAAMKPGAILATNTSSIALEVLREGRKDPARFAGLHFFNPVALMPLVEIVQHDGLDAETTRRLAAFCKAIDKLPVPVAGTPGFLVNRILAPYMQEAVTLFREGVPGPVIDKAALKFGMPMGPIELIDTVGLDVAASVGRIMAAFHGQPLPEGLVVEEGRRGKKDGQGLYKWVDGKAVKPEVPADYKAPDDLEDRLILPLVNEAVSCLADGTVADADLLDAGVIFGTGFAPFRGGPITHARSEGPAKLKARLEALAARHGERFKPRPGWDAL